MKKLTLVITTLCLLGLVAPLAAHAKDKKKKKGPDIFAQYDKNMNGVLDSDEKDAMRKDYAAAPDGPLKQYDLNNDGKLDDNEIAAIQPKKKKKKDAQ